MIAVNHAAIAVEYGFEPNPYLPKTLKNLNEQQSNP
jgi:hypothetical protein